MELIWIAGVCNVGVGKYCSADLHDPIRDEVAKLQRGTKNLERSMDIFPEKPFK